MSAQSSRLFIKVWRGCSYTVHQGATPVTAGKYGLFHSILRLCYVIPENQGLAEMRSFAVCEGRKQQGI